MAWVAIVLILILYSMTSVYYVVRSQEKRAAKWGSQSAQEGRQRKAVFTKAAMYISVYFLIWGPSLVAVVSTNEANGMGTNILVSVILPLQGFFNALIYSGLVAKFLEKFCCCCWRKEERTSVTFSPPENGLTDSSETKISAPNP